MRAHRAKEHRETQRLAALFGATIEDLPPEDEEEEAEAIAREHARLEAFVRSRQSA